jgi:hypothetical protein
MNVPSWRPCSCASKSRSWTTPHEYSENCQNKQCSRSSQVPTCVGKCIGNSQNALMCRQVLISNLIWGGQIVLEHATQQTHFERKKNNYLQALPEADPISRLSSTREQVRRESHIGRELWTTRQPLWQSQSASLIGEELCTTRQQRRGESVHKTVCHEDTIMRRIFHVQCCQIFHGSIHRIKSRRAVHTLYGFLSPPVKKQKACN